LFFTVLAAFLLTATAESGSDSALERFFIGKTEGSGTVDMIASRRHAVRDRTQGHRDASGALILDQTVEEEGKPARRRAWRLVRAGGGRITGTISDVRGGVAGDLTGNTLHLRYRMADGPSVEQWITLQPDGRTAKYRMIFHRFGLKVATVEGLIRRVE
jgi:hypothetical protein